LLTEQHTQNKEYHFRGHFLENQEEMHRWYYLKEVGSRHVNGIALDQVNFY